MKTFLVKWSVEELLSGNRCDGKRTTVARGEVDKEAESADEIRTGLTLALEAGFPRQAYGPTYNIDRIYNIEITEIKRRA